MSPSTETCRSEIPASKGLPSCRLERCNDVLKHQIAVLRISLEQQKRSQSVAEVKIGKMERDRADADLRNAALQREMELFFHTYGELKRGGVGGGRGGGSL